MSGQSIPEQTAAAIKEVLQPSDDRLHELAEDMLNQHLDFGPLDRETIRAAFLELLIRRADARRAQSVRVPQAAAVKK